MEIKNCINKLTKIQNQVLASANRLVAHKLGAPGQIALIDSVIKDLTATGKLLDRGNEWASCMQEILALLVPNDTKSEVKKDAIYIEARHNCSLKMVIKEPNLELDLRIKNTLRAARGLVFIKALENKEAISDKLAYSFANLFDAKKLEEKSIANRLTFELATLDGLLEACDAGDDLYRLLAEIKSAFQYQEKGILGEEGQSYRPANVITNGGALSTGINSIKSDPKKPNHTHHPIHKSGDLMTYNLTLLEYAKPKDYSGIFNQFNIMAPIELMEFMPMVISRFSESKSEIELAILLSFFLRCNPARFGMIGLSYKKGQNTWLEINQGYLCWNRQRLINRTSPSDYLDEFDQVKIPLPIEIARELQIKLILKPDAETLGDLLVNDLRKLKSNVRSFLYNNALTSHRPFLTRLSNSYARFALWVCGDEVYSAAIGCDFTLGVEANFNYVVLEPSRINMICIDVYQKLGLSGGIYQPVNKVVGSQQGAKFDAIIPLLKNQIGTINLAFHNLSHKATFDELVEVHNKIVFPIAVILEILCGLRKARNYSLVGHTLDLRTKLALVTDKASTEYLESRLVPMPEILFQWIKFYKSWLRRLAKRMSGKNKKIADALNSISDDACTRGEIALFSYIHKLKVRPIGSKHLYKIFNRYGLDTNAGRHFLDRLLRDSVGSALINAHAGRANIGQEAFGSRSALSVDLAMNKLRNEMDVLLEQINIPWPPCIGETRRIARKSDYFYSPPLWTQRKNTPSNEDLHETCPFHEFTLINAANFEKVLEVWFQNEPECGVGIIVMSLILADGVINMPEALHGAYQALAGRIYNFDQLFFIDTNTVEMGIRRIELSTITLGLIAQVSAHNEDINTMTIDLLRSEASKSAKRLLSLAGVECGKFPLDTLIEMSTDYYSIHLAGTLRDWMRGQLHARTTRVETIARHLAGGVESITNKNLQRKRPNFIRNDDVVINAFKEACKNDKYYGSNSLRMDRLGESLHRVIDGLYGLADQVLTRYAIFLIEKCPKVKSPNSVRTHYQVISALVRNVCAEIDTYEEFSSLDWKKILVELTNEGYIKERDRGSINYLMKMIGKNVNVKGDSDPAAAARTYAELPSAAEVALAKQIILELKDIKEHEKLAIIMLEIMAELPLRSEDVSRLRDVDVYGGCHSHIVITKEATGSKKTRNANRVLPISAKLGGQLSRLKDIKRSAYPNVAGISVFGNSRDPKSFNGADSLLELISMALHHATGSPLTIPYSIRHMVITREVHKVLSPSAQTLKSPLSLRQSLYEISTYAGHSDSHVTINHYVHDVHVLRRQWVNKIILENVKFNVNFIKKLTGENYEAVRKKLRKSQDSVLFKAISKFLSSPQINKRIFNLSQFLAKAGTKYEIDREVIDSDELLQRTKYISLCSLPLSEDVAAFLAGLSEEKHFEIKHLLSILYATTEIKLKTKSSFKIKCLEGLSDKYELLCRYLGLVELSKVEAFMLAKFISQFLDRPWKIKAQMLPLLAKEFFSKLPSAGFEVVVSMKSISVVADFKTETDLLKLGIHHVKFISDRNYASDFDCRISYVFKGDKEPSWPRRSPIATFMVSTFIIAHISNFIE